MKESEFFVKQTASSRIKAGIVSEYFPSYCKIITSRYKPKEIRYIDLFAGPGIYDDNKYSTPLLVAKHCYENSFLRQKVKMIFNDNKYHQELEKVFLEKYPMGTFGKKPHFGKSTVGENEEINKFLIKSTHNKDKKNDAPSVLFIDPFGYKGIETSILAEYLKNWGNELFLFVNTKRIHPALENEKFDGLMKSLFPTTLSAIREDRRYKQRVSERLSLIINKLGEEYESILGGKVYYTAFKFQEEDQNTTSHYILHITKGARGFDLVKTIYNDFANVGTVFDGVNTYTFDAKKLDNNASELFDDESHNIDRLKESIFLTFKGRSLKAIELFDEHHIINTDTPYSRSHYTEALRRLVSEGKLNSLYTDDKKHQKTVLLTNYCKLQFKE